MVDATPGRDEKSTAWSKPLGLLVSKMGPHLQTTTIVSVDDHDLVRVGLRDFLASLPQYEVVGEADNARDGLRVIDAARPHIVLMDVALPGMDGVVATREIPDACRQLASVILSGHAQIHDARRHVRGRCWIRAEVGPHRYADGSAPRSRSERPWLRITEPGSSPVSFRNVAARRWRSRHPVRTRARSLRLAADRRTSSEIARELCVARKTVDVHLNRINRKLGLRDRAELVRLAAGLGLVHSIRAAIAAPRDRPRRARF